MGRPESDITRNVSQVGQYTLPAILLTPNFPTRILPHVKGKRVILHLEIAS